MTYNLIIENRQITLNFLKCRPVGSLDPQDIIQIRYLCVYVWFRGGQWEADIFKKTVRMPPYVLGFSVNQFDYIESYTSSGVQVYDIKQLISLDLFL